MRRLCSGPAWAVRKKRRASASIGTGGRLTYCGIRQRAYPSSRGRTTEVAYAVPVCGCAATATLGGHTRAIGRQLLWRVASAIAWSWPGSSDRHTGLPVRKWRLAHQDPPAYRHAINGQSRVHRHRVLAELASLLLQIGPCPL